MPLLLKDAVFGYDPDRPVLAGISAAFLPGRVVAIVGPNGAGKTTLLRLLLGLIRTRSGVVELDGHAVDRLGTAERSRRLAYIPQRSGVAFAYSVRQVVAMGRYACGHPDASTIDRALEQTHLGGLCERPVQSLSAGQLQRVAVARALAQLDPGSGTGASPGDRYLLADEPTSAMDPWHALHTLRLLRTLASRGPGVVVVLHDLGLASRFADEVLLLDSAGALAAHGSPDQSLTPERLEAVFKVPFERVSTSSGSMVIASLDAHRVPTIR